MMLGDGVMLCARDKDVAEVELGQWRAAMENIGTNVSRAKTEYTSEWNAIRKCQYAIFQLPQVTEFKYMGSTLHSNGDTNI